MLATSLLDEVIKGRDAWPQEVKRTSRNVIYFNLDVLMPEVR